jgi:hypothetical protein
VAAPTSPENPETRQDMVPAKSSGAANGGDATTYLKDLPQDIASILKVFDFDSDGTINRKELCQAVRAYEESLKQQKFWRKMFLITFAAFLVLIACIGGLVYGITVAIKDNKTEGGKLQDNSGTTVQTDAEISSGGVTLDPLVGMTSTQLARVLNVPYEGANGVIWTYKPMHFAKTADGNRLLIQVEDNTGIVVERNKQPQLVATDSTAWTTVALSERTGSVRKLVGAFSQYNFLGAAQTIYNNGFSASDR